MWLNQILCNTKFNIEFDLAAVFSIKIDQLKAWHKQSEHILEFKYYWKLIYFNMMIKMILKLITSDIIKFIKIVNKLKWKGN